MLEPSEPPVAGVRVFSPQTARDGAQDAADGRRPGRHRAAGADAWATRSAARPAPRTSRKARATPATSTAPGSSAWRRSTSPRIIVAVMVDEPSNGKYYRRRRGRAGVQRSGAADAAHDGRAARLDVKPQIVARKPCGRARRASDGAAPRCTRPADAAAVAARRAARARCAPTAASAAGRRLHRLARRGARRPPLRGRRAGAPARRPAWSRHDGVDAFGFDDARVAALRGLKAATGADRRRLLGQPSRALRRGRHHRHQRQDLAPPGGSAQALSRRWAGAAAWSARWASASRRCGEPAARASHRPDHARPGAAAARACAASSTQGFAACAIEASSIGLVEQRLAGTRIEVALFTNFTQDHLDYHGNMDAYWQAKARAVRLARACRRRWSTSTTRTARRWPTTLAARRRSTCGPYSCAAHGAAARARHRATATAACASTWSKATQRVPVRSRADRRLQRLQPAGRDRRRCARSACRWPTRPRGLRAADAGARPHAARAPAAPASPLVVVDYAHTPDALDKALRRAAAAGAAARRRSCGACSAAAATATPASAR